MATPINAGVSGMPDRCAWSVLASVTVGSRLTLPSPRALDKPHPAPHDALRRRRHAFPRRAARPLTELRQVIELPAPPGAVWNQLWDIHAVAGCIPGCGEVETAEEGRRYRAIICDRVGPFRIAIPLEIRVEATPPERLVVSASGRDSTLGSPVKVALTVTLAGLGGGGTRLGLDGQAQVGGKLATLGQGVIERRTRDVLDQFAANLAALFRSGGD
jgi:uncharacterized protein